MPNNIPIRGSEAILFVWDTTDLVWEPVACLTTYTFTASRDTIESNTKCDPDEVVKTPGNADYEVTFEGEMNDDTVATGNTAIQSWNALFALVLSNTNIEFRIDPGIAAPSYFGDAIISELEQTAPAGDAVITFSGTFGIIGAPTTVDPHP